MDMPGIGRLHDVSDVFGLREEVRERTGNETTMIAMIDQKAVNLREVIMGLPSSRERATALTKLDEAVMWAATAIFS